MIQVDINAAVRKNTGKGVARSLRRAGMTPCVVYGVADDTIPLQLDTKELTRVLFRIHRRNAVVNLDIDDNGKSIKKNVLIREIQVHPVKDHVVHADFCVLSLDKERVFEVPVSYTGKAKGVDLGGELMISYPKVPIKGKPLDIPDEIVLDISSLGIDDGFKLSQLEIPAGVSLESDPERVCVAVVPASRKAVSEVEEGESADEDKGETVAETVE